MSGVLVRNISALEEHRSREEAKVTLQERLAEAITAFTGSMASVYLHAAIVILWVATNLGFVPWLPRFDRSFVILATAASVEAIFLSTFLLISQNRAQAAASRRADLDLQINLLAEHEVTRLIAMTQAIARKLEIEEGDDGELAELKRDVAPEAVLDTLAKQGERRKP